MTAAPAMQPPAPRVRRRRARRRPSARGAARRRVWPSAHATGATPRTTRRERCASSVGPMAAPPTLPAGGRARSARSCDPPGRVALAARSRSRACSSASATATCSRRSVRRSPARPAASPALASTASRPVVVRRRGLVGLWIGFGGAAWPSRAVGRRVGLRFRRHDVWFLLLGVGPAVRRLRRLPARSTLGHVQGRQPRSSGAGRLVARRPPALMTVVGAPFFEELFFRGVLLRGAARRCARTRVAIVGVVGSVLRGRRACSGSPTSAPTRGTSCPGLAAVGVVLVGARGPDGPARPVDRDPRLVQPLAVLVFAAVPR